MAVVKLEQERTAELAKRTGDVAVPLTDNSKFYFVLSSFLIRNRSKFARVGEFRNDASTNAQTTGAISTSHTAATTTATTITTTTASTNTTTTATTIATVTNTTATTTATEATATTATTTATATAITTTKAQRPTTYG